MTQSRSAVDGSGPREHAANAEKSPSAYRWFVLLLIWFALLLSFIDRMAWANVAPVVSTSLGLSISSLNIFVSAFFAGYVASNALGGVLTDRIGPRLTLAAAMVPLGITTFFFGSITTIGAGMLLQALMGLAAGTDFAACIKLLSAWFDRKHRAKAVGIVMTSVSFAVLATNSIIPIVLKHVQWATVYQVLGVVTTTFGALCLLLVRNAPKSDAPVLSKEKKPILSQIVSVFSDRNMVLATLAGTGANWATWGFVFWANALMQKGYGFTPIQTGGVIAAFGTIAIFAKPAVGVLSDWIGPPRKRLGIFTLAVFVASLFLFGTRTTLPGFTFAALLLGAVAFCWGPIITSIITELAGLEKAGSAVGVTNAVFQIATTAVPVVVGYAFSVTGSFLVAFSVLAFGPAISTLCLVFLKERT
nr:MFS transporter [Burkholderia cenocepacia]